MKYNPLVVVFHFVVVVVVVFVNAKTIFKSNGIKGNFISH